ncbi:MAG: TonB-dependent siderophore receptor [Pseudomonadota bacterium]|nr:TonB-dependent siderophore receptor [Pseudomonadota bacterium]
MKFLGVFGTVLALAATAIGAQESVDGEGAFEPLPIIEVHRENPPSEAVAAQLETIVVTGTALSAPRYSADAGSSATKTDTPLIETPQSISVLTRERLLDLGALTIQDALRYSAGVRSDAYGLDSRGDFAIVRGTEYVPYQDGLRSLFGFYNNVRPEVYGIQSVEILRGPSSVLYGQGTSGGMVNLTTKRPQATAAHELYAEFGDYDRQQISLDSTGPLGSEHLLYRLVAMQRDAATQVDYVDDDRWYVAPSLSWAPTDWLQWTVLGRFQNDESGSSTAFLPWEGTLTANPNGRIPTSRFVSEPGFDRYDTEHASVTSLLRADFGANWALYQTLRYVDSGAVYHSMFPNIYTGDPYLIDPLQRRKVLRVAYTSDASVDALTADHRLSGHLQWGNVEHLLLFGIDATHVRTNDTQGNYLALDLSLQDLVGFDLYDPQYGNYTLIPRAAGQPAALPELTNRQTGYYLQDQIAIQDRWFFVLGARYDRAESQNAGETSISNDETSLRAGVLYKTDDGLAPYLSYSESFEPVAQRDADGLPFNPVRGRQYEGGIKYQSPESPTLLTAAIFDIEESNRLAPGADPTVQVQFGLARIRGFELEATTTLLGALDLIASYTYLDAYSDDGAQTTGQRYKKLPAIADHSAAAWARWRFTVFGAAGFSLGAGVRYTAAIPDEGDSVKVPAVTLYDAAAAWESTHWRLAISGSNLEDETVLAVCLARGDCFYGPRRNVVGSVTFRF